MSDEGAKKRRLTSVPPPKPPTLRPGSLRPPTLPPLRSSRPPPPRLSSALRLSEMDFDLMNASRRIIEGALNVVPGERVVVVVDAARRDLGSSLIDAAQAAGATTQLLVLEDLASRPLRRLPTEIEAELSLAQASVALASFEDGEIAMRHDLISLVRHLHLRHGHMLGITRKSMIAGFSVEQARILDATRAMRTRLRPDSTLRVRSATGTDLEVRLSPSHRWAEHVGVIRPGRWENLPSGELVTSPAQVNGVYVADASVGTQVGAAFGLLDRAPVRFEIEGSQCRSVRSTDMTLERHLLEIMRREHNLDRVGLVILGTNVGIHEPTGEVICDQNRPGLHLAFGSTFPEQTGATWTTRAQILVTSANSDVDLDGMPVVRSGRCIV